MGYLLTLVVHKYRLIDRFINKKNHKITMDDKISMLLEAYGLDKKEIKIYLLLVRKKELNAYVLAKKAGIPRSSVYNILERLISKGFVNKIQKGKKIFYSALEISYTVAKMKDKESILLSLIPELEGIKEEGISNVRVLESKESQKQFSFNLFNQINKRTIKELYIISGGSSSVLNAKNNSQEDLSSRIFLEGLLKDIKRRKLYKNIEYKGIWNEKFRGSKILKFFSTIGENKFLKELPTLATTVIFGEYLAYLFTINGTPQVIEIQNKLISEENKVYFKLLWKIAKK